MALNGLCLTFILVQDAVDYKKAGEQRRSTIQRHESMMRSLEEFRNALLGKG